MIPVIVVTPNADGNLIHEVKAGQTLWQIAVSYATTTDEIKRLNNLFDNDIYPGTKLLVRKGVMLTPAALPEMATVTVTATSTSLQTRPTVVLAPNATLAPIQSSAYTRSIVGYVIGIVAIALFGGGLFMRLGNSKNE